MRLVGYLYEHFIVVVFKPAVAAVEMSKIFVPAKFTCVWTRSHDRCSGQRGGFASSKFEGVWILARAISRRVSEIKKSDY
jgi:hypothetical protein